MGSKGAQFGWQGELSVSGGSHRDIIRISPRGWAARAYLARANSCRPAIETKDKPLDNLQRVAETDFLPADFYRAGNSPIRQPPRPAGQALTRYPKPPAHFSRHTKSAAACFACMTQQKKRIFIRRNKVLSSAAHYSPVGKSLEEKGIFHQEPWPLDAP